MRWIHGIAAGVWLLLWLALAPCLWRRLRRALFGPPPQPRARFIGPESVDLPAPCRVYGTHTSWAVLLGWLALGYGAWTDLLRVLLGRPPLSAYWYLGLVGLSLALLTDAAFQSWLRYRLAILLVDLFEVDETLLPAVKERFGDQQEPSHAAYEAAVEATYQYIGSLTWGNDPCRWGFSFRARFAAAKGKAGWYIPEYPWLTHLGGPALLEVDSEILLVTERLTDPRPQPVLPGDYFVYPLCTNRWRGALHLLPRQAVITAEEAEPVLEEQEPPETSDLRWLRFNAELRKFGRVRYPVLFGLRSHTVRKKGIWVRTRDGLPLHIPNVSVAYELFHQGWRVREARHRLPREAWQYLAWQATLRLMRREASHWDIHSATALASYVISGALDAAFRKVFARYTAAELLDRVQKATLSELLNAWPPEARGRIQDQIQEFLDRPEPVSWERIHDEILDELNGLPEAYTAAEKRGLFVTQLSFDDWRLPRAIREAHRQALRAAWAWDAEDLPSRSHLWQWRVGMSEGQRLADLLVAEMPALDYPVPQLEGFEEPEARVYKVRQAWFRVIEYLLDQMRWHPRVRSLFGLEGFLTPLTSATAPNEDAALVLWFLQVQTVLISHPYGGETSATGPPPEDFLGGAHS